MKKILTWIKNNPYKVLQNVWMLLITLLLGFVVIQQNYIESKTSAIEADILLVKSKVSNLELDLLCTKQNINSVTSVVYSINSYAQAIQSSVSFLLSKTSSLEDEVLSIKSKLRSN